MKTYGWSHFDLSSFRGCIRNMTVFFLQVFFFIECPLHPTLRRIADNYRPILVYIVRRVKTLNCILTKATTIGFGVNGNERSLKSEWVEIIIYFEMDPASSVVRVCDS